MKGVNNEHRLVYIYGKAPRCYAYYVQQQACLNIIECYYMMQYNIRWPYRFIYLRDHSCERIGNVSQQMELTWSLLKAFVDMDIVYEYSMDIFVLVNAYMAETNLYIVGASHADAAATTSSFSI